MGRDGYAACHDCKVQYYLGYGSYGTWTIDTTPREFLEDLTYPSHENLLPKNLNALRVMLVHKGHKIEFFSSDWHEGYPEYTQLELEDSTLARNTLDMIIADTYGIDLFRNYLISSTLVGELATKLREVSIIVKYNIVSSPAAHRLMEEVQSLLYEAETETRSLQMRLAAMMEEPNAD